jgi:hypothetical protein
MTVGSGTPTATFIGKDHGNVGLVGGINVALTRRFSFDFEFIGLGDFKQAAVKAGTKAPSATTFVFDPGVIYNWGPLWTGLRLAIRIPAPNGGAEVGVVPIIGKAFKISRLIAYYIELDLPVFINNPFGASLTTFVQTGVGF